MSSGRLSSRELTRAYLQRIDRLNPLLGAVIETNPNAIAIAAQRDAERRAGIVRGPMHGIPVLLKDNIATDDSMQTTAGSVVLLNSRVPADSPMVARLREAGAVILGKANLSEWANFRGFGSISGWSARGGFSRNPYLLNYFPAGSSSGSAISAAANLCSCAVGTETSGSITTPASYNHTVGIKPTVGLISQSGIIPISNTQDTAGPMTRTVTDAAILLGAMQSPWGSVDPDSVPNDYTAFLDPDALQGARIGIDRKYFSPGFGDPAIADAVETAITVMGSLGATFEDTDSGDIDALFSADDFLIVLLYEFRVQMANYLGRLKHTAARNLADLIRLNQIRCPQEMKYFGQELFELAITFPPALDKAVYQASRQFTWSVTRTNGIDKALQEQNLDAIIAPGTGPAVIMPAVAGYPSLALPLSILPDGRPAGMYFYSGFLQEPKLISLAYALEQALPPRATPMFLNSIPPEPPDAGICAGFPKNTPGQGSGIGMRRGQILKQMSQL
ncbi:amidase family protein [Tautonia marina]|uniref:amidase family protein n=1 Tax=Tautonia marina TaxID=2653855 RepID=UPI00191C00C8|nr:amidase family protein [Tautonia marina]